MTKYNPNSVMSTDSYKFSHYLQYPEGTEFVSSYIEARGGDFEETVFFGLQAYLMEVLSVPITEEEVKATSLMCGMHGVHFNYDGWMTIVTEHEGYLPLEIKAVAEGTVMPTSNVQVQVTNTVAGFGWLVSHIETALLRSVWYPSTVATISREAKKLIMAAFSETSDSVSPDADAMFKLHDFGARGASSGYSAMLGGMGHLVNFMGTDTFEAILGVNTYYGVAGGMAGFSIPASEHSTITSWSKGGEVKAFANMLEKFPTGLVACVSDSYDLWHAVDNLWGEELKDVIMARDGTLVVRPDSGDPLTVPVETVLRLMAKFGYTVNSKGYKVLPSQVRVIQGDGMTIASMGILIKNLEKAGIAIDNIAFGMGGGLLQKVDRDTLKYAMKANSITIHGVEQDVYKDPITDSGKRSKRGELVLIKTISGYHTVRKDSAAERENLLRTVYYNGELRNIQLFDQVRERAKV